MGNKGYGVEALRATSGEGISGFSSRSDQARARELARHGLTMDFYDSLVESQNNLCAECHRPERVKLANGKKRQLGLGFGADGRPDRLLCQSCCSQQRKERAEDRKQPQDYADFHDMWLSNREKETDAELLKALRDRHAHVTEVYDAVCDYVRGTDRCPEGLQDTLDEVEQELIEHGTVDLDQLSSPFYKVEHRHLYDEIQAAAELPDSPRHARNCATYARFGYLQALPVSAGDHVVREFLRKNGRWPYPDWSPKPNPIKTIRCSTYQCKGEFTYNQTDRVPNWYFSEPTNAVVPPSQWFCDSCRAKTAARKPVGIKPRPEDQLFMSGRVMSDLQSPNLPDWLC